MNYNKGGVILFVIIVNALRIHGILNINLPPDKIGYYGKTTQMNCTDNTFDIAKGYSWFKDNVIIYNFANGDSAEYKSSHGTDYFTLEITNTRLTDNGVYRCNYFFQDQSDTLEIQATGKGAGKVVNDKLEITFTGLYPVTATVSSVTCNGQDITGSTTSTITDSFLTLAWISSNNVDSSDLKAGCDASVSSRTAYSIQVTFGEDCICECDCECRTIVIVSIVFGILGALGLLIIVVGIPAGCFNERETLLLASGVIGIVFDVLSLVLSIVVTVKECCECCEENCEDSECCAEDSECCKDWIDNAAMAFIVIPCVAIVVSVVIFILVKLDKIGPGSNAYKAKEAKEPGENHGMTGTSM